MNKRRSTLRKYNLTLEQYDQLWNTQHGLCAVCFQPETAIVWDRVKHLAVDHCHKTGHVRGLLCTNCNLALGGFKDDKRVLKSAINYLVNNLEDFENPINSYNT